MDRTVGMFDPQVSISIIMTFVTFLDVAPPDDLLTSEASIAPLLSAHTSLRMHPCSSNACALRWNMQAMMAIAHGYSTWL
jgi:hypothetical protein